MKFSIGKKITMLIVGLMAIIAFTTIVFFISHEKRVLLKELDERGETLVGNLSANLEYYVLVRDIETISKLGQSASLSKDVVYCKIEDKENNILFEKGPGNIDKMVKNFSSEIIVERIKGREEDLITGMGEKYRDKIGMVYLKLSLEGLQRKIYNAAIVITVFVMVFILLSTLVSVYFLNRILNRPIKVLINGINKVASGDLNYKVNVKSKDEIGEIANAFNRMTEDLSQTIVTKDYVGSIIDSMMDSLVVISPEGIIKTINESTNKMLYYNDGELIGKHFSIFFTESEKFSKILEDMLKRKTLSERMETKYKTKNNSLIPVECLSSILKDKNDKIEGIIIVAHDLREVKRLQEQLIQTEKLSAVGQLAGGVAHEINNPIGVILGFAQLVAKDVKENDPLYMPLKSIEREAIRCKKLVVDLLTFSRMSKSEKEFVDINDTIEQTLSLVESRAKMKNVKVIREYEKDLPKTVVNKNQIQQVIVNLCNNAMDAMPNGGTITITTKSLVVNPTTESNKREFLWIGVSDTGTGMTEEVKKHIFEPFFTTKEVGKGTGLGLSLCYEIIQKHEGSIEVESEVGKGSTFVIKLPVKSQ